MSAASYSLPPPAQIQGVLGELLHSLSQPLTTLRCSLELELELELESELALEPELPCDEGPRRQQKTVAVALQQTEKVIGIVQLIREYLNAENTGPENGSTKLAPVLRSVIEDFRSIAAVRNVQLHLVGTCAARVQIPEPRLRLAFQYLLAPMIEAEPAAGKVMLLLGEGPAGAVLRGEGSCESRLNHEQAGDISLTMRRVRLSIAGRVLEAGGASLVLDDTHAGFVLRCFASHPSTCRAPLLDLPVDDLPIGR